MYLEYYGLTEAPFTLNPDPDFLYLGEKHLAALNRIEYGLLNQAPFCVLTGDVGTGKTVVIRHLINNIQENKQYTVGFMTNTQSTAQDLLTWILLTFNLDCPDDDKAKAHQVFYNFLIAEYASNRQVVLIVDEAQNLDVETLERLRLLSNINADKHQVLQTILVGQDALQEMLKKPELKQFAQRITFSYHLEPFNRLETHAYIIHRLAIAGAEKRKIFSIDACDRVFHYSHGTPRLINALCDAALVYGYSDGLEIIEPDIIEEIVQDKRKGHILPLSEHEFVPEDQKAGEIDALYENIDSNVNEKTETIGEVSGKNGDQRERGRPKSRIEPEFPKEYPEKNDHQSTRHKVVELNNQDDAEAIKIDNPASEQDDFERSQTEILDLNPAAVDESATRYRKVIPGVFLLLLALAIFLWKVDPAQRDIDTNSQTVKNDSNLVTQSDSQTNLAHLNTDLELNDASDETSMITVEVEIPRLVEPVDKGTPETGIDEMSVEGENVSDGIRESVKTTLAHNENTELTPMPGSEVDQNKQTGKMSDENRKKDSSIEQVKNFFQFLTPDSEDTRQKKVRVVVKHGDTLSRILRRETGDFNQESLAKVLKENPGIINKDQIYIGQVIYINRD